MRNKTNCPVCNEAFESLPAMRQHFNDKHRAGINETTEIPESTIDNTVPVRRCENCLYWGRGNNLTVCRKTPGEAVMMQMSTGLQCVSMYPPKLANEWCGEHKLGSWTTDSPTAPLS